MNSEQSINAQEAQPQAQEKPKNPWGYAVTKALTDATRAVQVPGQNGVNARGFKVRGYWSRPEVQAVLKAVHTNADVAAAAEALAVTESCVLWRLRWLGLATPATEAKAGKAKAEVAALAAAE